MTGADTGKSKRRARKRGAGEGSIHRRPDGLWIGRLMVGRLPDGKPNRRQVSARTRDECQKKLDELKRQAAAGMIANSRPERLTVAGFLERWHAGIRGTVREITWERYEQVVRLHIAPALGHHRLTALRPYHLQQLYAAKRTAGLAPASIGRVHAVLHRALNQALKEGEVPRNVAKMVDRPRLERRELQLPSPVAVSRLIDAAWKAEDRMAALWTMAAYSGCRRGELLGLTWADVDLERGAIQIRRSMTKVQDLAPCFSELKTARSRRTVTLPGDAVAALHRVKAQQAQDRLLSKGMYANHDLVFATPAGTPFPPRTVGHAFKRALKRAELPASVRLHDLRHFAATLMLAAGVHPKIASERLGHSQVGITMDLYTHAVEGLDRDAAERMQEAMNRAKNSALVQ